LAHLGPGSNCLSLAWRSALRRGHGPVASLRPEPAGPEVPQRARHSGLAGASTRQAVGGIARPRPAGAAQTLTTWHRAHRRLGSGHQGLTGAAGGSLAERPCWERPALDGSCPLGGRARSRVCSASKLGRSWRSMRAACPVAAGAVAACGCSRPRGSSAGSVEAATLAFPDYLVR